MSHIRNDIAMENRYDEAKEWFFSNAVGKVTESDFEAWFKRNFTSLTPYDMFEKLEELQKSHAEAIENIREHGHGE